MKLFVLLLVVELTLVFALPRGSHVTEGEFLIRLDENLIQTIEAEKQMINYMERRFNLGFIKSFHLGKLSLLHVQLDEANSKQITNMAGVLYVEPNKYATLDQCVEEPSPGTWGLDRIDQREQVDYTDPLSNEATYRHGVDTGAGGSAYIIDSGIDITHPEFGGRARWGFTSNGVGDDNDGNGHGTHCAGTIGSQSFGVAKDVEVVAVKVINTFGFGTTAGAVQGMEWVLSDHIARQGTSPNIPKSVVNMSLGYPVSDAVDDAVEMLADAGITVVASAGNDDGDACNQSPSRSPFSISSGASSVDDVTAWFSNFGSCVTLYAPGQDVLSTIPGGTAVFSGTSMSAPHIVGAVARYQSSFESSPSFAQVRDHLTTEATADALSWFRDAHSSSPNLLLYSEC